VGGFFIFIVCIFRFIYINIFRGKQQWGKSQRQPATANSRRPSRRCQLSEP
jgi:hypothetical protein